MYDFIHKKSYLPKYMKKFDFALSDRFAFFNPV